MAITDGTKTTGLLIAATETPAGVLRNFEANAQHFTWRDWNSTQNWDYSGAGDHPYKLTPRPETIVSVSYGSRGTGGASCGPETLLQYRLPAGDMSYSYTFIPFDTATDDPMALSKFYRKINIVDKEPPDNGYLFTAEVLDDSVLATLEVSKYTPDVSAAMIIVALYDDRGALYKFESEIINFSANGIYTWEFAIKPEDYPNYEFKAFAWDAVTYVPLDKATEGVLTYVPPFAVNSATSELATTVSTGSVIYMGTGAGSTHESYTDGQKYFRGSIYFPNIDTAQPFTFDVDIYPTTTTPQNQYIMGVGNERWGMKLYDPSGIIQVWCHKTNAWTQLNITSSTLTSAIWSMNRWYRLTVCVPNGNTGNSVYVYLNGSPLAQSTSLNTSALVAGSAVPFSLGSDSSNNQFNGYIGNVRVCNVALSAEQVAAGGNRVPVSPVGGETEIFRLKLGTPN